MCHKEFRSSFVDNHNHVQHRCSYSGFTLLFSQKEMPDFYLVMDVVKPVESFAMRPQMITQSVFQMWYISMTDGCQMAAWERAEKGTI